MNPAEVVLLLTDNERESIWSATQAAIEDFLAKVSSLRVTPESIDPRPIREAIAGFNLDNGNTPEVTLRFATEGLTKWQVHTPHPGYFGLFNPATTTMGIAADALVAAFNPQIAAWSHSPFAAEIEQHLLHEFGSKFGMENVEGTFCSGGAEANHTAMLLALNERFPQFKSGGARLLSGQPTLYVSEQAHHSMLKAAAACGIGASAVRVVPIDQDLRIIPSSLIELVDKDRAEGKLPFLLVATAGSTSAGSIDPLPVLAELCAREGLWFHVDAAWGGAAALVPELRPLLAGIERADSVTFDAHKFLSVPMGCGMLMTQRAGVLARTFGVTTAYMPKEAGAFQDPFTHSMQWSRRFMGLKLFLSIAVAGWDGYAEAIRWQATMGRRLREGLESDGWTILNRTNLPVVCFTNDGSAEELQRIADEIVASGLFWISTTRLYRDAPALRACVTNFRTAEKDVDALVEALRARRT